MKNISYVFALRLTAILIVMASLAQLYLYGAGEESVRAMIAGSARTSAVLFSLAFGISSIHYFFAGKISTQLLKYRAHFGLSFGVSHTFHLYFLFMLQNFIHPVFTLAKTSSLIGGGLAYAFMYVMVFTTFPKIKSKIKPANWKALHTIGGYWIWFIFLRTYYKKVFNQGEGYVLLGMLVLVFVLRMLKWFSVKRKKAIVTEI